MILITTEMDNPTQNTSNKDKRPETMPMHAYKQADSRDCQIYTPHSMNRQPVYSINSAGDSGHLKDSRKYSLTSSNASVSVTMDHIMRNTNLDDYFAGV